MRAVSALGLIILRVAIERARHTAMSITMSTTIFSPSDPLTWKQADTDVHVATRAGEFAGFVEFDGSAHLARDQRGIELGSFESLDAARAALERTRATPHPSTLAVRLRRALMRRPRRARA